MKVTLILADSAQAVNGKLYILGGGWSVIGPQIQPMAVALRFEIPWDQTNILNTYKLILLDADGKSVILNTNAGKKPLEITKNFEVGRPPGHIPGTPISFVQAINFGPLPLKQNSRYIWELQINDESNPEWSLGFSTRPQVKKPGNH